MNATQLFFENSMAVAASCALNATIRKALRLFPNVPLLFSPLNCEPIDICMKLSATHRFSENFRVRGSTKINYMHSNQDTKHKIRNKINFQGIFYLKLKNEGPKYTKMSTKRTPVWTDVSSSLRINVCHKLRRTLTKQMFVRV